MSTRCYEHIIVGAGAGQDDIEMSVRGVKSTADPGECAVVPLFMQRSPCANVLIGWFILALVVLVGFACVSILAPTWMHSANAEKLKYESNAADQPMHAQKVEDKVSADNPRHSDTTYQQRQQAKCCWDRFTQLCTSAGQCDPSGEGCILNGSRTERYGVATCSIPLIKAAFMSQQSMAAEGGIGEGVATKVTDAPGPGVPAKLPWVHLAPNSTNPANPASLSCAKQWRWFDAHQTEPEPPCHEPDNERRFFNGNALIDKNQLHEVCSAWQDQVPGTTTSSVHCSLMRTAGAAFPVCELRNASLMLGRLIGTHQERFDGSKPTPHYLGYGRHDGALASEPVYDDGLVHVNCRSLCCSGLIHLKAP